MNDGIIDEEESKRRVSPSNCNDVRFSGSSNTRIVQNFLLVWLDIDIDEVSNHDRTDPITKLRQVVNTVNKFTDIDECIDFITNIEEEKIFIIFSETVAQIAVSIIHDVPQINAIYIFCEHTSEHEQWPEHGHKIKGVFRDVTSICEALKKAVQECDQNIISMSFVPASGDAIDHNLDQLDQSFMNTQILKEILLTLDFEQKHIATFITYCREQFIDNEIQLINVDKLEAEYRQHTPIWWYTYQCFLYSMLNKALRTMEVDIIIKLGFFLRDLHEHIAQLYSEQFTGDDHADSFIVYRGQGLPQKDFDQFMKTKAGLLSFNNFLSTSKNYQVSLNFARHTMETSDLVGILFVMTIDSSVPSTPFANVREVSDFKREEEILFSMHSIFRIGEMKQIDGNNRLWQVDLTLTSDDDRQLHAVTECIREETFLCAKGWDRLGRLLIKLGEFDKAQQVYDMLMDQALNDIEKTHLYHMVGVIKDNQAEYAQAIAFYEKSIEIQRETLPSDHLNFAAVYNNVGSVYDKTGEYSEALSYYEKALKIYQETLPSNHFYLAAPYNNIGLVCEKMGEYSKALSYHEKAFEIYKETYPPNHPYLAASYDNMGKVLNTMGDYTKALSSQQKALEIDQKTLPPNHPDLANSYTNIGLVYKNMGDYAMALSYYEKALEIKHKTLSPNHPDLATSYNNLGSLYHNTSEYSKALSSYEKALEIRQKTLSPNHPDLANTYNNLGLLYHNTSEYSKALLSFEKALEIRQKALSSDHPKLASSCAGIAIVYYNINDYSKALSFIERALDIGQRSLPENDPDLEQYILALKMIKEKS